MTRRKHSNRTLTIAELEARMRPGSWSFAGFLGPTESLETAIARDTQTLTDLGVSHEQIADALETILLSVQEQRKKTPWYKKMGQSILYNVLTDLNTTTLFSIDNLPDTSEGYLVDHFQVMIIQTKGCQECPWECEYDYIWGSFDFLILNRKTCEYLIGPGMIVHLLREHHFFEGLESPYRVDPTRAIDVLGLGSKDK